MEGIENQIIFIFRLCPKLTLLSYRAFSIRLAESYLLQYFCQIDKIKVPSKSALERYEKRFDEEIIRELNMIVMKAARTMIKAVKFHIWYEQTLHKHYAYKGKKRVQKRGETDHNKDRKHSHEATRNYETGT